MLISWSEVQRMVPLIRGVIHIGAHRAEERGSYLASGLTNTIWCEADPEMARWLKELPLMDSVRVFGYAVCDEDHGVRKLYVASNDGASSSLLRPKEHLKVSPPVRYDKTIQVPTITLDTLLHEQGVNVGDYNFITVDIEGAELLALAGATKTLPHIDAIYTEVSFAEVYAGCGLVDELDRFLADYCLTRRLTYDTTNGWGDALYVRVEPRYDEAKLREGGDLYARYIY